MMKIERVLIPTDFSEASIPALRRGLELSEQFGAEAHLLHVNRTAEPWLLVPMFDLPPQRSSYSETAADVAREALAKSVAELAGKDHAHTLAVKESSYVPEGILEYATEMDAGLIVMGTHGRQGARRFLMGSVAEEIVRKSPCPVLTVKGDGATRSEGGERPKKILGAVDLEEGTDVVVATVRALAERYGATMEFLHVVPPMNYLAYTEFGAPVAIDGGKTLKQAAAILAERLADLGVTADDAEVVVESGVPDAEIVERAEKDGAEMIVVATHARVGLPHVLLGSVADRVLRTAECPVLTVLGGTRSRA